MAEVMHQLPDFKDMGEEELWDLINDNRHAICLGAYPCVVLPYLRQARVLNDLDEDEILSCLKFTNRSMRTSHMLDLLRIQGRNGAVALMESLMIHYPPLYTQITGRKPCTEASRFSGLIKYSELTEYLVRAVTGMQKELQAAREEASEWRSRSSTLQGELSQLTQQGEDQVSLQAENTRLRNHLSGLHRDLMKLKDEKCDLYIRYAAAVEEKSEATIRCRELTLQLYQLQCELKKVQTETDFQKKKSLRRVSFPETEKLRDEILTLRRQLQRAENITPACQDILAQDLQEATDWRSELAEQLRRLQEENEVLMRERNELLEEKDGVALQVQKLTVDCEMYQQKSTIFHHQLGELQAERDQAYLARDEAQVQIARSLAEKDTLRGQLMELQNEIITLKATNQRRQDQKLERPVSWDSSSELGSESPPDGSPRRLRRLCRMNALPLDASNNFESSRQFSNDGTFNSRRSSAAEPPCLESLRRRETDSQFSYHSSSEGLDDTFCLLPAEPDFELISKDESDSQTSRHLTCPDSPGMTRGRASAPPFLVRSRPQAVRIMARALSISFQGEKLLSQLQVIGGNRTGVFVDRVTEGSSAHNAGIGPGAQILQVKCQKEQQALRMVLEDSTMEEALWALGQVDGPCSLLMRPKQDTYQNLLRQLKQGEVTSGDSFYVRVNMSLLEGGAETLSVSCNDILHVTNSHYGTEGFWWASQVNSCQLVDVKSGTVPNYYRAQRQLIRAIEDLSFQHQSPKKKSVRIVSTTHLGRNPLWVSVEEDNTNGEKGDLNTSRGCVSLMPYTLVTPYHPPVCRPVLLLPTILGSVINKRLAEQTGYQLCEPETLGASEHAAQMQKGEVLQECDPSTHSCYTVQCVEKITKRGTHCVLPLGLDSVRRLHRAHLFPIIIFVGFTERSARRLKNKLRQNNKTEAQLLECSRSEEPLLDKLPCLYRTVSPESWSDTASLLLNLRNIICEEQKKIVWVEPDLW